jgi:hypothetical protein
VELIDDEVVPRRLVEPAIAPLERCLVVDDGVADRVGQSPGARVDPVALAGRRLEDEAVLGAGPGLGNVP